MSTQWLREVDSVIDVGLSRAEGQKAKHEKKMEKKEIEKTLNSR